MINQQLLGDNQNAYGPAKTLDIETAVIPAEPHQIQTGQVAGRVVQKHILTTWVTRVDPTAAWTGVPVVDSSVILHARIVADSGTVGNQDDKLAGLICIDRLIGGNRYGAEFAVTFHRLHKFIRNADREIGVLEHNTGIGLAVIAAVVALLDKGPGLSFLLGLTADKILNVRMMYFQRLHLGGPTGFAAALDHRRDLIEHPHKTQRPGRVTAATEFLPARAQRGKIGAGATAVLKQHRLTRRQGHNPFHSVIDTLNKTGGTLGIFISILTTYNRLGLRVPMVVMLTAGDAVDMIKADIEPDRRIESCVLIHAKPG